MTGPMTLPQVDTKLIEPRILAKFFRPKYSPTVDQLTGKVDSTVLNKAVKSKIAHSVCTTPKSIIDATADSMQAAISLGLLTLSPSQPNKICDGSAMNAWAARKNAARCSLMPVQTMSAT